MYFLSLMVYLILFFILEYVYITADSTKYTQHICSIVQHI